ncbi:MAG: Methionine sulfoxide reductase B [Parcubacteria group bacterium GW2011_GWA2_37_10]|nr:MAG: Methionine sulfoxide reductase B [Parcubacteria group bacterium GW2011_GWA2_37_10]
MEKYKDFWEKGMYKCNKCGNKLFSSEAKFNSRTMWPSFRKSMKNGIRKKPDYSI